MLTVAVGTMVDSARMSRRERDLLSTPSRFMQPRLILYVMTFGLVALGLLMIYSSSSVTAMAVSELDYNAAYYLQRQLIFGAIGLAAAAIVAVSDYHLWVRFLLPAVWIATIVLLGLVLTSSAGLDAYGATRWISIGGFNLQPSEFAKITVILTAANVAQRYYEDFSISFSTFTYLMVIGVGLPLGLIILQPDKGTTIICAATLYVMGYLAGMSRRALAVAAGIGAIAVLILAFKDDYSRARVLTVFNPWKDPYGDGYQLIQGFYAFGSGGLFGVGIGLSRQKYSYLPMAHNDFIFAVIGEELGLAGTLGMLLAFAALAWAGLQIARYAPDLSGRLVAAGCTVMIVIQLLVNICGVLGMIPLTGKPVPFVSYGGSSIISCLLLVGFIASVSRHSSLPDTVFDERRRDWSLSTDDDWADGPSFVGEAMPRSARGFTVVGGGLRDTTPDGSRASQRALRSHEGRVSVDSSGRRRIDLGPSASDRLRSARGSGRRG